MQLEQNYTAVIIGSGFGGQCAAIKLSEQGISDYVILERRSFIGGTWSQNRYPGAAVDVQSPLYSLSFEPYDWTRMFAHQDELEGYTQHIFTKHGLRDKTQTGANVTSLRWCEETKHWQITINEKVTITARFIINASGPLSTPVIPSIKGQEKFEGLAFHTNDWDQTAELENKNVAIIGSGASAAQVIPAIVDQVKNLHVFQRSPHWIIPRWDYVFKPWQRKTLKSQWSFKLLRWLIYWGLEIRILGFKYSKTMLSVVGGRPARKLLQQQIQDPELRDKLTPDFTIGCKRVIISSTFLPALAHKNTRLHDKHDPIVELTQNGGVTQSGEQIPIDVLVYSTGYDAADGIISYPVYGKGGKTLSEVWSDYPRAYLGTSIPDFPNLFIVTGPNTGIGHTSALFVIESQMIYIMKCINSVKHKGTASIEVTTQAEDAYTEMIHNEMQGTVWQNGGCHSWYQSKSGKVTAMFPGFSFSYRRLCKRFKPEHHLIQD